MGTVAVTFRKAFKKDIKWRLLDAALHLASVCFVPGHWWYQYLPDTLVPVIWLISMYRNRPLPLDSRLMVYGRRLHSFEVGITLATLVVFDASLVWLSVHWLLHLLIDSFTHESWENDLRAL